ncbi:MAG: hypothetical protein MUO52_14630 [Desulfobacterales bacterium]|nr:hypothetical protein [Desulfobacterales bacterium]
MNTDTLQELVNGMAPEEAASALGAVLKKIFPLLDDDARLRFVLNLVGETGDEKVASLIHL